MSRIGSTFSLHAPSCISFPVPFYSSGLYSYWAAIPETHVAHSGSPFVLQHHLRTIPIPAGIRGRLRAALHVSFVFPMRLSSRSRSLSHLTRWPGIASSIPMCPLSSVLFYITFITFLPRCRIRDACDPVLTIPVSLYQFSELFYPHSYDCDHLPFYSGY